MNLFETVKEHTDVRTVAEAYGIKVQRNEILDLYHASLKQFEPLPRCVFLYRVV